MKTTIHLSVVFFVCAILFIVDTTRAVDPGERPPREVMEKVQPLLDEARRALEAQDGTTVRTAVTKSIAALGPWAGKPETATRYYPPIATTPFDATKLREWWLKEIYRRLRGFPTTERMVVYSSTTASAVVLSSARGSSRRMIDTWPLHASPATGPSGARSSLIGTTTPSASVYLRDSPSRRGTKSI